VRRKPLVLEWPECPWGRPHEHGRWPTWSAGRAQAGGGQAGLHAVACPGPAGSPQKVRGTTVQARSV